MKHLSTAILLFIASLASAQIVNIPDTNFKQALLTYSPSIDTNGDGEIQTNEAAAVTSLTVNGKNITDLTGITALINLESLHCQSNLLTALDISGMSQLDSLDCNFNSLATVNLNNCTNLRVINLNYNMLSSLDVIGLQQLSILGCTDNRLTSLDVSGMPALSYLDCTNNQIANLNIDNCRNLGTLRCLYNQLTTLDVTHSLDSLKILWCSANSFDHLNIINCPVLHEFYCETCGLNSITLNNLVSLQEMSLNYNNLTSIDVSTCPRISNIGLVSNNLVTMNLKNGPVLLDNLNVDQNPDIQYACVDDDELPYFLNFFPEHGFQNVNVSSYCSFTPGGAYNTIMGSIKADVNNNGCDSADPAVPSLCIKMINGNNINYTTTSSTGKYSFYTNEGNFSVIPYFPYPYFNISPVNANINFAISNYLTGTADFCVTPNGIHNDLEVTLLPVSGARPGFSTAYQLVCKNKGTTVQSGTVQLNYDYSKMNFSASSPVITSQGTGQLTWNYTDFRPFESRIINLTFNLLPPPVNNMGDTLTYLADINPVTGDEMPYDNSFILMQGVVSSFDPNNKQCLEGNNIVYDDIDKSLHYIIRFQNTGTDTAFNVVVADSLSDKFDWNSVEIISSSHTCDIQQRNGRLEFFFQNIMLPYSSINEPASHGYVAFSIKPKANVTIGDSLNNRAAIYFDFNLPVITNTASTIVSPASTVPVKLEYFSVIKKEATNLLTWKAPSTTGSTIFNIERSGDGIHFTKIGDITATAERSQLPFNFIDANPLPGKNYYQLKITDADGVSFYSKILVIGNNKSGLDIIAITSDHNNVTVYFNSDKEQTILMKIIAGDGKLVYSGSKSLTTGSGTISLPLRNIATGIYTLVSYTKIGGVITKRFIK